MVRGPIPLVSFAIEDAQRGSTLALKCELAKLNQLKVKED